MRKTIQPLIVLLGVAVSGSVALADTVHDSSGGPVGAIASEGVPSAPEEVVREVVERNKGTEALEFGTEAAGEIPSQAGSLPDPLFMVGLSNLPLSTDSTPLTGVQFELRQTFPWPGKLAAREKAAAGVARSQRRLVDDRRNMLRARAWVLLWELSFLREHRRLVNEMSETLRQFVDVAEASYVAGSGRQQDLIKPQVERYRIEDLIVTIDRRAETIKSRLNAMRHRPPSAPIEPPNLPETEQNTLGQTPPGSNSDNRVAPVDGDRVAGLPNRLAPGEGSGAGRGNAPITKEVILEYARTHNPRLAAVGEKIDAAAARLDAARKDYFPDITVGLQYRLRWVETIDAVAGADFIGVTLGVNLPVWFATKQRSAVRQRLSELSAARSEYEQVLDEITDGIESVLQALARDAARSRIYGEKIIPEARQALESSLADYRAGRLEFISVLDNLLKLFSARVELARRLAGVQSSLAQLEYLLGGRPEWFSRVPDIAVEEEGAKQ